MAAAETGTADFASTFTRMSAFALTTNADAAVVNLREGSVSGTIRYVVKNPVVQSTFVMEFPKDVVSASGVWFVDLVSGTTPQMTITSG